MWKAQYLNKSKKLFSKYFSAEENIAKKPEYAAETEIINERMKN